MSAERGYVYVMVNPMLPDTYKIGATILDPIERARQLSASSGVPYPYTVAYQRLLDWPFKVEAALHRMLDQYRVNDSREFFKIKLHKIIDLAEDYEEVRWEFYASDREFPFSRLFASFPDDHSARSLTEQEQTKVRDLEQRIKDDRLVY